MKSIAKIKYIYRLTSILLATILFTLISSFIRSEYALADVFGCYQATGASSSCTESSLPPLNSSNKCILNQDYKITSQNRESEVTVLAIHGGKIEAKTSDIVRDLANTATRNWNFYDFEADITNSDCNSLASDSNTSNNNYEVLHITSTRFNEANAVNLVQNHKNAIAIHGHARNEPTDKTQTICVGGANEIQIFKFIQYVEDNTPANLASLLGYSLDIVDTPQATNGLCLNPTPLTGTSLDNIVNKNDNQSGRGGLQLELSRKIRDDLAADKQVLTDLIYGALDYAMLDN